MTNEEKAVTQKAILVGVADGNENMPECDASLAEMRRLAETAGAAVVAELVQVRTSPDSRTYIGSGKVEELAELCAVNDAVLVIFDVELTPSQIRNIEELLQERKNEVSVIDRSMLILDIFALHAVSGEGKLQVELAQLRYTAPRLMGKGAVLSRQGGGIGTRGPGESKLESDKRHLQRRIHSLQQQLAEMEKNRGVMRAARERSDIKKVAIVGYTNAGKSTLLNHLTDAGVLAEDKLFATLDPTTRHYVLPDGEEILLTDTVGFIRHLPHHLVNAFHSTLEEAALADILIIVADATDPACVEQLRVTDELLEKLGATGKPTLLVYNKCDLPNDGLMGYPHSAYTVFVSAKSGEGMDKFLQKLQELVHLGKRRVRLLFPYDAQGEINALYGLGTVESTEYGERGVDVVAVLDEKGRNKLQKRIVEEL